MSVWVVYKRFKNLKNMNDKDLIEFFIYLRDHCYNRDFSIEPKRVVECFYEYRNAGYKLPIPDVNQQREQLLAFCDHLNTYAGMEEIRFDFMMQDFIEKANNSG